MVGFLLFYGFCLSIVSSPSLDAIEPIAANAQQVRVMAELDSKEFPADQPITGVLQIDHPASLQVDATRVVIEGKPLAVEQLSSSTKKGSLVETRLRFSIPGASSGPHLLPPISILVGGHWYSSPGSTYQVGATSKSPSVQKAASQPTPPVGQSGKEWLKLENIIDGKSELYPGQKTRIGYRFTYTGNIQLVEENLPLLEPHGFKKIGGLQVANSGNNRYSVREVLQEVEAIKAGDYRFEPGSIAGYTYQLDARGQPQFREPKLQANAAPFTLTVQPLPPNPPPSFNGAIGRYQMQVELLSPNEVTVGDRFTISIEFTGDGDVAQVPMPEVCCQPGFVGDFKLSNIPPIGVMRGSSRFFVVELRPLNSDIRAIPSLAFTSFDPKTGQYITQKSPPIPVRVFAPDQPYVQGLDELQKEEAAAPLLPAKEPIEDNPLEDNSPLEPIQLPLPSLFNWWGLLLLPLLLLLLWYQLRLRQRKEEGEEASSQEPHAMWDSERWLFQAKREKEEPAALSHALRQAFISLLIEEGYLAPEQRQIDMEQLPPGEPYDQVRAFFLRIEEGRFHSRSLLAGEEILQQAEQLFRSLKTSANG